MEWMDMLGWRDCRRGGICLHGRTAGTQSVPAGTDHRRCSEHQKRPPAAPSSDSGEAGPLAAPIVSLLASCLTRPKASPREASQPRPPYCFSDFVNLLFAMAAPAAGASRVRAFTSSRHRAATPAPSCPHRDASAHSPRELSRHARAAVQVRIRLPRHQPGLACGGRATRFVLESIRARSDSCSKRFVFESIRARSDSCSNRFVLKRFVFESIRARSDSCVIRVPCLQHAGRTMRRARPSHSPSGGGQTCVMMRDTELEKL